MRRVWITLYFCLTATVIFAQIGSQGVVVVTPVSGRLVFSGSTIPNPPVDAPELLLVDTAQGAYEVIVSTERSALSPKFDLSGEKIVYSGDNGLVEYFVTSETQDQVNDILRYWPHDFSPDGQSILAVERLLPPNPRVETLGLVDIASGTFQPLFTFAERGPIT